MTHWKLTLAYDGTPYRGWQIQPNLPTVQGLLSDAIHRTTGERVLPQGSGRTDAGVHALAQVASFSLAAPIPAANLHRALNRCLMHLGGAMHRQFAGMKTIHMAEILASTESDPAEGLA